MKHILTAVLLFLNGCLVWAQENKETIFLQTKSKTYLYYIGLRPSDAIVYTMGFYLDKASANSGNSIRHTDTLPQQPGGTFGNGNARLVTRNNEAYLIIQDKKTRTFRLDTVTDIKSLYADLNKAWYLDHFFAMCDTLNKKYPMSHYSFRNGYNTWNVLPDKDTPCLYFRALAAEKINHIKDSLTILQSRYAAVAGEVLSNLKTMAYDTLLKSLAQLPDPPDHDNRYFLSIVEEVSKQQPEYFFRLAENFPKYAGDMYLIAATGRKEVIHRLREVQGHDMVKKQFLRYRRSMKTSIYTSIGAYAAVAGLIIILI